MIDNEEFDGINNIKWCEQLIERLDNHDTEYFYEDNSGKWWLIGKRK